MSTTYNHGTLKQVDDNGNVKVLYPKGYASDILLSDDETTVQEKITELNSDLGAPSSASDVEGNDAFAKIHTLKEAIGSGGGGSERITPLKTTTFPSDGSILETYSANETVRTTFNPDGSISEIHTLNGAVTEHRTVFNSDGSITVTDQPYVPPEEPLPSSLEDATWTQIKNTIADGTFSQYASVGDTKSFDIGGKTYHAEVVAINDGTGSAASWYPDKTVDFICTELYETVYAYNSTSTNTGGFPSSALRGTLINTLYPLLPSDLKNVIIEKSHSYITSTSGTMSTDSTKLWLPTHYEIDGTTNQYATGESSSNNKAYTLASKIKKQNGQSSANHWWLGSLFSYNATNFWRVIASGSLSDDTASTMLGVPVCFRIGQGGE